MDIVFTIPGEPKGKQRARTLKSGISYTPKQTIEYETWVKECFLLSKPERAIQGQIGASVTAYFSIPKSTSNVKREKMIHGDIRPTKKPDRDNIEKIIFDSLNKLAYDDDSQIVTGTFDKFYGEEPRVEVELWEVE